MEGNLVFPIKYIAFKVDLYGYMEFKNKYLKSEAPKINYKFKKTVYWCGQDEYQYVFLHSLQAYWWKCAIIMWGIPLHVHLNIILSTSCQRLTMEVPSEIDNNIILFDYTSKLIKYISF